MICPFGVRSGSRARIVSDSRFLIEAAIEDITARPRNGVRVINRNRLAAFRHITGDGAIADRAIDASGTAGRPIVLGDNQ